MDYIAPVTDYESALTRVHDLSRQLREAKRWRAVVERERDNFESENRKLRFELELLKSPESLQ